MPSQKLRRYVIPSVAANPTVESRYITSRYFCLYCNYKLHNFIFYVQGHESSQTQKSTKGQKLNNTAASRKGLSTYSHLTSDGIWSNIKEFAKSKYQVFHFFRVLKLLYLKNTLVVMFSFLQFEVPDDARLSAKRVSVLRNLCQKVSTILPCVVLLFVALLFYQLTH